MCKHLKFALFLCLSVHMTARAEITNTPAHKAPLCVAVTGYQAQGKNNPGVSETTRKIIELSFADSPYSIYFRTLPHKRALREVKLGQCDAIGGAFYDSALEQDYIFSTNVITEVEVVFFKRKDRDISWESIDDLKGLTIGSDGGIRSLQRRLELDSIRLSHLNSDNKNVQNFLRLAGGRIDLLAMPKLQGETILSEKLPPKYNGLFDTVRKPLSIERVHMVFSKNVADAMKKKEAFDKGLVKIKNNGTLKMLIDEHQHKLTY